MTLSMAWIRTVGEQEELVFASDSRLSGGSDWDCCPKLMPLTRGDSLMAFAGNTFDAYPLMLQFRNWIESDPEAADRSHDINELKKRMRIVFNDMRLFIFDLPHGQQKPDPPDCEIIFGGWSWQRSRFNAWRFFFDKSREQFDFEPAGSGIRIGRDHPIVFAGTREAVEKARSMIIERLQAQGRFRKRERYFDMEPFEALRDIIRSQEFPAVGGAPQLVKVYKSGNSKAFAVAWDCPHDRKLTVFGRPLFPAERTHLPTLDPDAINFLPTAALAKRKAKAAKAAAAAAEDFNNSSDGTDT